MTDHQSNQPAEHTADSDQTAAVDTAAENGTSLRFDYQSASHVQAHLQAAHVALFTQLNRSEVEVDAAIKQPLLFRDSLAALFEVVRSDYRYVPKDRSAYAAYLKMRKANANAGLFAAQRAYFDWLFINDPLAYCILDPIIQVHEHGITFEVFSRDEGCYAQLTLDNTLFDYQSTPTLGTTHIDYSSMLYQGIENLRSYQQAKLEIGHDALRYQSDEKPSYLKTTDNESTDNKSADNNESTDKASNTIIEKRITVKSSWIRALLQVQAASQLPKEQFSLDPLTLYNVLFELRMHADKKGKRRGLVIELVPNQVPTLMLEPFGTTFSSHASPYTGRQAKIIRLWGRRRLSLLKRLLPHTDSVTVSLLGQGMPSFWTLTGQGFTLSFAMTGFSESNWSQSLNFDLLLPKRPTSRDFNPASSNVKSSQDSDNTSHTSAILSALQSSSKTLAELKTSTGLDHKTLTEHLISGAQQGLIRHDLSHDRYFFRPLSDEPLDMSQFAYHSEAEKLAYELMSRQQRQQTDDNANTNAEAKTAKESKPISKLKVNVVANRSVTIAAEIFVSEDRRSYYSEIELNEEGMVSRCDCSCPQFLQHRLTQGVCPHLITLRLAYANYDASKDAQNRWQQTAVYSKQMSQTNKETSNSEAANHQSSPFATGVSQQQNEQVILTQQHKKLIIERQGGKRDGRQQQLFNKPAQAHAAFLAYQAKLARSGFIEN